MEWKTITKKSKPPSSTISTPPVSLLTPPKSTFILEPKPEIIKVREISLEFKNSLQLARTKKGYTRKQLAQLINEKLSVIEDLENGKTYPTSMLISKLNRVLDIKLPKLYKKTIIDERDELS